MDFSVLGPLTVSTDDRRVVHIPESKVRALLTDLLVHAGEPVSIDRLVFDLWGDELPRNPTGALQTKVSRLRRALTDAEPEAAGLVVSRPPGYLLRVAPGRLDAAEFTRLTAAAYGTEDARSRATLLSEALALWKGDAFADMLGEPFVRTAAAALEEQRLVAYEVLAETQLDLGEHHLVIGRSGEMAHRHPLRERLWAVHIRSLYRAGRQAEALAAYNDLRERLADELGVDPSPTLQALQRAVLEQHASLDHAPRTDPGSGTGHLPAPVTELIGRSREVSRIHAALAAHRLVTVTGPGGVGKTRLAVEVAGQVSGTYRDGVELITLADTTLADAQVSAALGVREDGAVSLDDTLRSRQLLLVLDNCEHVLGSVAGLASRLLAAAPGVRILATSREPLGLAGENVVLVPALSQEEAERLFAVRAAAAAPGFRMDAENRDAVATICRRLDRLPLALELAATRVRALGVLELAARLDDRFQVLSGGYRGAPARQQTLRAVIDWSWNLLAEDEQAVLRCLAVHAGGFTLEAAEAVCEPAQDVLGALVRLVDSSLVTVTDGPRYGLPESVAAYALERLAEAGEAVAARRRHHAYYADLAERAAAELQGPEQHRALRTLDDATANLRAALERARQREDAPGAARIALALVWYWFLRGRLTEARRSLQAVLTATAEDARTSLRWRLEAWHEAFSLLTGADSGRSSRGDGEPDASPDEVAVPDGDTVGRLERARAEWFLAYALFATGQDLPRSERLVARARAEFQVVGDRWGTAAAEATRAKQALMHGDLETVGRSGRDAYELFDELRDAWGRVQATYPLAALAEIVGDYEQATTMHREGLQLATQLQLWTEVADRLSGLGRICLLAGEFGDADDFHHQARQVAAEQGYAAGEVHAEIGLALGARRQGHFDVAERYLRKVLEWHRQADFGAGPALLLTELGFIAEQRGELDAAVALHLEGLAVARSGSDPRAIALAMEGLAGARALGGEPAQAARLLGTAARLRASTGAPLPYAERGDVDRATDVARSILGERRFTEAFDAGVDEVL